MIVETFWRKMEEGEAELDECLSEEELEIADAEDLAGIGLTCADRDALLAGGKVPAGAAIICTGCQDRLAAES